MAANAQEVDFPESFYCPLTHQVMHDPVVDPEGNSYERSAIETWLTKNATSPVTRAPLTTAKLAPNRALKEAIERMVAAAGIRLPDLPAAAAAAQPAAGSVSLSLSASGDPASVIQVLASVTPPATGERTPADICCVIDVSGSMASEATFQNASGKQESHGLTYLDVVKHAVTTIIHTLGDDDRLAIVEYSSSASVTSALLTMSEREKKVAEKRLQSLQPGGSTNLWDGLKQGMDVLREGQQPGRVQSVFILTDGMPNIVPPRGHLPMLRRYRDEHGLNCTINTFGFGYSMDSPLLQELAQEGDGTYAFIPDSAFVGTSFVNALSNLLSVQSKSTLLSLEPADGYVLHPLGMDKHCSITTASWGASISLATLHYGQSRDFVFELRPKGRQPPKATAAGPLVSAFVDYQPILGGGATPSRATAELNCIANPQQSVEIARSVQRQQLVHLILTSILAAQPSSEKALSQTHAAVEAWIAAAKGNRFADDAYITAVIADANGQVKEATSQVKYYQKWGKHYLPSLARAHVLQQCNNFKDPGVQSYGGALFNTIRDVTDDIFISLPPPKPSAKSSGRGSRSKQRAAPTSMKSYYCSSNPCFSGRSLVRMADGSRVPCNSIRKGDQVACGSGGTATVRCVVQTMCAGQQTELVTLPGNLEVTPYHPVRVAGRWSFPIDLGLVEQKACEAVFSYVLDAGHSMEINGVECVTLGHSFAENDVVAHPYFGSQAVVQDLQQMAGWASGLVVFQSGCMIKSCQTDLIVGFDLSRQVVLAQ